MPNDVALEIDYDGISHDLVLTGDVFDEDITIQRGDGAESAAPRPASMTAQLNNDDDEFRISNPLSPLYGKAGRNTPLQVSVGAELRSYTEASSWQANQSRDFRRFPRRGKAWVDLESGGLLQRINQWTDPLRSPLARGTLRLPGVVGSWPLEDDQDATALSQTIPGASTGTYSGGLTLGNEEAPGGASQSALMGTGGKMSGKFLRSTASGWQFSFSIKLTATPGTATTLTQMKWFDSIGRSWEWQVNNGSFTFLVTDRDGTALSTVPISHAVSDLSGWLRCRIKTTVSAGTITYEPAWYAEGAAVAWGTTATFAAPTTGCLTSWSATQNAHNLDANYVCVFGTDDTTADLITNPSRLGEFNGHIGETTVQRFTRLMGELNIAYALVGSTSSTTMGVQRAATLAELLQEIRDTEDGLLYDARDAAQLVLFLRDARYNQGTVTIDVSELVALPREVTDDLNIHNLVTVSNRAGGTATAEDTTTALSTQAPPDGVGVYEQNVDVSLSNDVLLPQWANWWMRRGTVDLPRYPSITVNLATLDAARVAEIEALDVGQVIELTGLREYTVRLHILGYTEVIGWPNARTITFVCAPDQQFDVGTYDADRRYNLRTCTLSAQAIPTATTLTLAITDDEEWSQTSAYDLVISGELIGVPAGGMSARSGTLGAYVQTITGAARSKNGIRKTLPAGSTVRIATPGRWAL